MTTQLLQARYCRHHQRNTTRHWLPATYRSRHRPIVTCMSSTRFLACEFEVFGRVQGVFFRAHTVDKAKALALVGWVANTRSGTVQGVLQGNPDQVREMQSWLRHTGSPASVIENCVITNERPVDALDFNSFDVRRTA